MNYLTYGRSLLEDGLMWVRTNETEAVGATAGVLLAALILIGIIRYYKTAGERRMRMQDKLAKTRLVGDKVTELLLQLCVEGKLTTKDMQEFTRKFGINADMHDLIPRKAQKELKTEIKRRLYSNNKRVKQTQPDGQVTVNLDKLHNITNPNRQHVQFDPVVVHPAPEPKKGFWLRRIRIARPFAG